MTTESQDRRELIVAASAELFARKGIRSTTVREIADAVGLLSGSLYHYFASKDEIVQEILLSFLESLRSRYAAVLDVADMDPAQALRAVVLTSLQAARERPDATLLYQNELRYLRESPQFKKVHTTAAELQRVWLDIIERGVAAGVFRADIDPRLFHRLVRDAVWLSGRGHRGDGGYDTEELADAISAIFLDGYATGA